MQALILATGETDKPKTLTERAPSPMLPVLSRPVMAYPVEVLARAGWRDVGVSLHRMAGSVEAYFGTGSRWGVRLSYLLQSEALGSAGAIRWAGSGLRSTFVVLPGDAILDLDLHAALAFHRSHGGLATVVVNDPHPSGRLRPVCFEQGGRVASLSKQPEGPETRVLAETGAYIFEPGVLDLIPPRQPVDCYSDLLPAVLESGSLHAYLMDGYWNPLDSVGAYHQAQLDVLAGATGVDAPGHSTGSHRLRYPAVQGKRIAAGIVIGRYAAIHPAARLAPPVYIGDGCQIERDVELGPGAVIGANVIVDEGATIRDSSVLSGTYVGRMVNIEGRVAGRGRLIDTESGDTLPIVDRFLLGEASPEPIDRVLARAADIVGALLLLLIWSPVIALIALGLLLTSPFAGIPGRILERRTRVRWRRDNEQGPAVRETYQVISFRTRRGDQRPVPLGSWLERWQMERLPWLWNVLRGDLRLVGVRPLAPLDADRLTEEWQRRCYEGFAGFTGLWYVESAGEMDLDSIVVADAYYTATRTPWNDLRLVWRTSAARAASRRAHNVVASWSWPRGEAARQYSYTEKAETRR